MNQRWSRANILATLLRTDSNERNLLDPISGVSKKVFVIASVTDRGGIAARISALVAGRTEPTSKSGLTGISGALFSSDGMPEAPN